MLNLTHLFEILDKIQSSDHTYTVFSRKNHENVRINLHTPKNKKLFFLIFDYNELILTERKYKE